MTMVDNFLFQLKLHSERYVVIIQSVRIVRIICIHGDIIFAEIRV